MLTPAPIPYSQGSAPPLAHPVLKRWLAVVFLLLAVLLVAANAFLLNRVKTLRAHVLELERLSVREVGGQAAPILGMDPQGRPRVITLARDGRKTVIFVLSPSCGPCNLNWPNWRELLRSKELSFHPVFVDLSDEITHSYMSSHGIADTDLVTHLRGKSVLAYGLGYTPETIVVDRNGRIERIWSGYLSKVSLADIRKSLSK